MRSAFDKWKIPSYAVLPFLAVFASNFAVYYLARLINLGRPHYDVSLPWDDLIPLVPAFVIIYVLAYVQWVVGYWILSKESKTMCFRFFTGAVLANWIGFVIFILYPSTMVRPEITGTDFFSWGLQFVYNADLPDNLFPSFHCMESWICMRIAWKSRLGKPAALGMTVFSVLVFASTLLVHQHALVDVAGGIVLAEVGLLIARLLPLPKRIRD